MLIGCYIAFGIFFIRIPVRIGDHISVKPYEIDAILHSEVRPACTKDRIRNVYLLGQFRLGQSANFPSRLDARSYFDCVHLSTP